MSSYTVQSGDTLTDIARRLGVPLGFLQESNPQISNPNRIKPGQVLDVPKLPMGETKVEFDPNTNPNYETPFAQFPTPESGSTGSYNPFLSVAAEAPDMPSPMAADATATAKLNPLEEASKQARDAITKQPREAAEWFIDFGKRIKKAMDGGAAMEELIGLGVDSALLTVGGGSAAAARFGTGPKHVPHGPRDARLDQPLPEGNRRELAGQDFAPNTGTAGLFHKTFGTPSARARMAEMGENAVDPLWWDAVVRRVPAGQLKNTPDQMFNTTTLGGNVIPFDPKAKKLTDPKTNLERRMARRGEGNVVLGEDRFNQASVAKHEKAARAERQAAVDKSSGTKPFMDVVDREHAVRAEKAKLRKLRTEIDQLTPEQWEKLDPAARNHLIREGFIPQSMVPKAPKPLTSNSSKDEFQARIDALKQSLLPGENLPDFP